MSRIEDYVEAVTRRLRPDPELHMDIAHEVRAHLEDAGAEARARGLSDEEGVEAALKAFGDRDEIAERIWQANRRRMRLRAVVKWAARVTLVPAAMVLALILCAFDVRMASRAALVIGRSDGLFRLLDLEVKPRARGGMSEEELFKFEYLTEELEDAQVLLSRYADDPVLYAHHVRLLSEYWNSFDYVKKGCSQEEFERWLAILERGKEVEPDNAFYNYLKATLLMLRSSELEYETGIRFEYVANRGGEDQVVEKRGDMLVILDRAMFERAMHEVYEGIAKPRCTSHAFDVTGLKASLWERPTTLEHEFVHIAYYAATLMPHLAPMRQMVRRLPGFAVVLAEEGKTEEAARLASMMHRPAVQFGAGAGYVIELLVAQWAVSAAQGQAPGVYEKLGMPEKAAEAHTRFEQTLEVCNSLYRGLGSGQWRERAIAHGGVTGAYLMPRLAGPEFLPWMAAIGRAEHVVAERLTLGLLVATFALLTLILGSITLWNVWRYRRTEESPKLLFVGWKRLGLIVLVGLVVPLAIYWVYTRLTPLSSLRYGINYTPVRRALELGAVYFIVVIAVLAVTYNAVRGRCKDAGIEVAPAGYFNPFRNLRSALAAAALAGAVGLTVASAFAYWYGLEGIEQWTGITAAGVIVLFPVLYALWQARHLGYHYKPLRELRRAFFHDVLFRPVALLLVGVLVLTAGGAILCTHPIDWPEFSAIVLFSGAVLLPLLLYALLQTRRLGHYEPQMVHFRRSLFRSMVPVLAACLLAVGLVAHVYLRSAEAAQLRLVNQPGKRYFEELEMTTLVQYRDHLRELNQEWVKQHSNAVGEKTTLE